MHSLRRLVAGAAFLLLLCAGKAQGQLTFDDIRFWTGSGANRAALVIDWKSGSTPQSLVWGFRWDGSATGLDLLEAVRAADPRLYREWVPGLENQAVFGVGYDVDGDGFSKTDPQDKYREGWFTNGFWGYYVETLPGTGIPTEGASANPWQFASSGPDGRTLTDGSWDGMSWAQDFNAAPPALPSPALAPVPEPGTLLLGLSLSLTGGLLAGKRKRSRQ